MEVIELNCAVLDYLSRRRFIFEILRSLYMDNDRQFIAKKFQEICEPQAIKLIIGRLCSRCCTSCQEHRRFSASAQVLSQPPCKQKQYQAQGKLCQLQQEKLLTGKLQEAQDEPAVKPGGAPKPQHNVPPPEEKRKRGAQPAQ